MMKKKMGRKSLSCFVALAVMVTLVAQQGVTAFGDPVDETTESEEAESAAEDYVETETVDTEIYVSDEVIEDSAYEEVEALEEIASDTQDIEPEEPFEEDISEERLADAADREEEAASLTYQKLTAKVQSGNAGIATMSAGGGKITLEGVMPEGAYVRAEPVNVEIDGIAVLAAYDITIYDAGGEEFEPEEGAIRVHVENAAIREAEKEDSDLFVYHMKSKNANPERIPVKEAGNGAVEFDAEEFSIYVVGEDDQLYEADHETPHYIYTVNFYIEDMSEDPVSSQTLSAGEYVEVPGVPEKEHAVFMGWYTEPNGEGVLYDLASTNLPAITEDTELDLFAHYTDVFYVYYMEFPFDTVFDVGHENVVFHTEVYTEYAAVLDTSAATDLYRAEGLLAATEAVTGWRDAGGNPAPDVVENDLELYPVIDNAYWIYFDVGEGMETSVDPVYVLASSAAIGDLPDASCTGYTFDGWYTDPTFRTRVTSSTTLASLNLGTGAGQNDSVTLYAKWSAAKVAYTVNIWRQKATDGAAGISNKTYVAGETYHDFIDYYDFAESFHVAAANSTLYAGDSLASVTPTQSGGFLYQYTRYGTTSNNTSKYYGFEYAANRTQNDVRSITSVAADGSTVINIFYDRATITWNFGTSGNKTATGTLIGLYGTNCETDTHYGTLSGWPATQSNQIWHYEDNVTFEATFVILSGNTTINFTTTSFNTHCYGYYYLELTNENQLSQAKEDEADGYKVAYIRQVNSRWYVYDRRINLSGATFNFTDKYAGYAFAGYNKVSTGSADNSTSYKTAKEGESDLFRQSSGFFGYSYYDGYFFNNAIEYTITLVSSDKNVGIADNGSLYDAGNAATYQYKYGTDLSNVVFPGTEELDGAAWGPAYYYEFDGTWMEDPIFTAKFIIPSTMPANNLVAYADWELRNITVRFDTGTEETTYEDQVIRATETAEDPGIPAREGYEFVGWMDQKGKIFNLATVLYEDTTLTAIWKDLSAEGHTLTFDLNIGNSYGLFEGYGGESASTNSERFASGSEEELWTIETAFPGIASIEGAYAEFICWNTAADGSGTNYYPDDKIEFGNQDITLYAVWANKNRNEATLILDHNYPAGYKPSEGESTIDEITRKTLTDISLEEESNLTYHEEITVADSGGETHLYRFEGWSTTKTDVSSATDDDVNFAAAEHVAVDTIADASGNTLYAVWLEVYNITVTKEVVNNARNYTVPEGMTFDFTWSVLTGDGETATGTASAADQNSFTINDVASGETVTIAETAADGFTVSYNGAQGGTTRDGVYTFEMGEASTEVIVTNTVRTNQLRVNKVWKDVDGKEETGTEHDAVTVTVYEDGTALDELALGAENNWTGSIELVVNGDATYKVSEIPVDGYIATVSDMEKDEATGDVAFTVTNSETPHIDIEGSKTWNDSDNQDGRRPESITICLMADGSPVAEKTVTAADDWKWSFTDLDQYAGGTEIVYTISENAVSNYTTTYVEGTYDVTNSYTPETTTVTITKEWDDDSNRDGKRPDEVTVTLNGTNDFSRTITLNDENNWTTIVDVPMYYDNGQLVAYSVSESTVSGYEDPVVTTTDGYNFIVTNTHTPEVIGEDGTITIAKTWNDDNDHDAVRPDSVEFTLTGTVTGDGEKEVTVVRKSATLTSEDGWTGTIEGLYRYCDGKEITYTLTESLPEGYTGMITAVTDKATGILTGYTVVNSHDDYTAAVTVKKEWKGDDDYKDIYRPDSVTVHLMSDGADTNQSVVLTGENDWTDVFENVPVFEDGDAQHGQKITYTVTEENLPAGYTASETESELVLGDDENYTETVTVTNTLAAIGSDENPVTITKEWKDGGKDHANDSVSVTIYSSNWMKDAGGYYISETDTLNEENNWTVTVSDLPKYTTDNTEIEYVVTEETVEGYSTRISDMVENADGSSTFTVTNTALLNGTGELKVSKIWSDANDQDGIRPERVAVQLYVGEGSEREAVEGAVLTLETSNEWTDSFTGLEQYDVDGQEITYTVKEINFSDKNGETDTYTARVTGDTKQGFTVTNTHTPETITVSGTKTWDYGNDPDTKPASITIDLRADGGKIDSRTVTADKEGSWAWSFTDLPKYRDGGTEIVYTITEDAVENYTTTINKKNDGTYTVTNTYSPEMTTVTINKVWDDKDDRDGKRPDDVTVTLTGTNGFSREVTLNDENAWIAVVNVPMYDNEGGKVEYNVTEKAVEGYEEPEVTTGKDSEYSFTVTNRHDVTDWSVKKKLTNSGSGEGGSFRLGEKAEFTITVANTGNTVIDTIEVTEVLEGAIFTEGADYTLNEEKTVATITELPEDGSVLLYAEYIIEEKDLGKDLVNSVTTTGGDPDDPEPGDQTPIPTEDPNPHLTVTKTITGTPANGTAYAYGEEIQYRITVTNDGNLTITDITVTDELTGDEWKIASLAPGASEIFETSYKVTMEDVESGSVVNEATVEGVSPDPEQPDVPSDPGTVEIPTEPMSFFPMDEEIVPGNDDESNPDSWIDRESVNEYDAIEIEMSTTLPEVSGASLTESDFGMTFHNQLVTQLVLDDLDGDFTVDINGTPIDQRYYEIDLMQGKRSRVRQLFHITDGCSFHVNVDLSALYNDGVIDDDDLGTGTVRVFFYVDLETTDVNGSYTSTAWYDVADGDKVLYTSDQSVVTVYTFEIIVNAYDQDTTAPLSGAEYGLYYDEECSDAVSRNGEAYIVTTDENGQGMFVGVAEGTYYVKEIVKPDGYESIAEPMAITLAGDEDSNHIFEVAFPYAVKESGTDEPESSYTPDTPGDPEKTTNTAGISVNENKGGTGGTDGNGNNDNQSGDTGNTQNPVNAQNSKTADAELPVFPIAGCFAAAALIAAALLIRRRESNK